MTVPRLNTTLSPAALSELMRARPEGVGTRPAGAGVQPPAGPVAPARPTAIASTPQAVPAEPPQGTDPELWSVLSAEERTFYAKVGAMGPLTYGRVMSAGVQAAPPAVRGLRLDVKA